MNTTLGGMPVLWAQDRKYPAARAQQNLQNDINLKRFDKNLINLINVVWGETTHINGEEYLLLATNQSAFKEKFKLLLLSLQGYKVVFVMENEQFNKNKIANYTSYRYALLFKWAYEVMKEVDMFFPLMGGGWMMPQSCRTTYERMNLTDKAAAKAFKTKAQAYGVWGSLAAYQAVLDEIKYFKQFGVTVLSNFHFQQYYDILPDVVRELTKLNPDVTLSNNEAAVQKLDPATVTGMVLALKGNVEYLIWYNGVEGDGNRAVTLDSVCQQALEGAMK